MIIGNYHQQVKVRENEIWEERSLPPSLIISIYFFIYFSKSNYNNYNSLFRLTIIIIIIGARPSSFLFSFFLLWSLYDDDDVQQVSWLSQIQSIQWTIKWTTTNLNSVLIVFLYVKHLCVCVIQVYMDACYFIVHTGERKTKVIITNTWDNNNNLKLVCYLLVTSIRLKWYIFNHRSSTIYSATKSKER